MKDIFNENNEYYNGNRVADATTRFNSHPSNNPFHSIFEPCDNMLIYGKDKGSIEIVKNGLRCNYIFTNNADTENLPTFERLESIFKTAGSTISAKMGTSVCGMGIEVFGLECRPTKNSTVICEITIVRDGLIYGGKLYFDGQHNEIRFSLFSPQSTREENKFVIKYINCQTIKKKQAELIKAHLCDKLYFLDHVFNLTFNYYGEEEKLIPADFTYSSVLKGTENYVKREFYFEVERGVTEDITFEFSNTYDIIKQLKGNHIDKKGTKADPNLAGVSIIYGQYVTVCRGDESWRILERNSGHSTLNHVRCNVTIGDYLFSQFHMESQVKNQTNVKLSHLVDKYGQKLVFIDKETGEKLEASKLVKWISSVLGRYETDSISEEQKKQLVEVISNCNNYKLNTLIEILEPFKESKIKLKSVWEIIEKEYKEPCLKKEN